MGPRPVLLLVAVLADCGRPAAPPSPKLATCPPRSFSIAGACLSPDEAADYCGKGAKPEEGGCARSICPAGEATDLASGECVPALALRKIAVSHHVDLKEDTALGCANPEAAFVVEGSNVACVPHTASCGRGARWADGACHPDMACPPGSAASPVKVGDGGSGPAVACVPVVHKDRADTVLDVGTWIRLVLGPDGGDGTPAVCGPLAQRPGLLGVVPHGKAALELELRLVFPDNDVNALDVAVMVRRRADAHGETALAPASIADALQPLWKALRLIGGTSNAASATVTVECAIESGSAPTAVPSGGAPRDAGADTPRGDASLAKPARPKS